MGKICLRIAIAQNVIDSSCLFSRNSRINELIMKKNLRE